MPITLESLQRGPDTGTPRILLFGTSGIGKSSFASQSPNSVFLFTEKGKGRLTVPSWSIKEWNQVGDCVRALLTEDHDFKTVVVDTIDWLESLIHHELCKHEGKESIEDFGYGKGYTKALTYWDEFLDMMDALHEEKDMGVILIGHSIIRTFQNPEAENYDQYQLNVHAKAAAVLKEWADAILFANYEVRVKTTTELGKVKAKPIRASSIPRLLHTEERPAYWAKNRYGLPETLPLDWGAFEEAMASGVEEQKEVMKQLRSKGNNHATA